MDCQFCSDLIGFSSRCVRRQTSKSSVGRSVESPALSSVITQLIGVLLFSNCFAVIAQVPTHASVPVLLQSVQLLFSFEPTTGLVGQSTSVVSPSSVLSPGAFIQKGTFNSVLLRIISCVTTSPTSACAESSIRAKFGQFMRNLSSTTVASLYDFRSVVQSRVVCRVVSPAKSISRSVVPSSGLWACIAPKSVHQSVQLSARVISSSADVRLF
jgi:hypothetical protein